MAPKSLSVALTSYQNPRIGVEHPDLYRDWTGNISNNHRLGLRIIGKVKVAKWEAHTSLFTLANCCLCRNESLVIPNLKLFQKKLGMQIFYKQLINN